MSNLNDKEIGYIAGIIDGEGTICISKRSWKARPNTIYFQPFIKIANTNLEVLMWIKDKLQTGTLKLEAKEEGNWKACYSLMFSSNMIRKFLPIIIDSLIIKKQQAFLILDFMKLAKCGNGRHFRSLNNDKYISIYEEVKRLNTRGVISKSSKFGETLPDNADGNPEPSINPLNRIEGVCNDYRLESKDMR